MLLDELDRWTAICLGSLQRSEDNMNDKGMANVSCHEATMDNVLNSRRRVDVSR